MSSSRSFSGRHGAPALWAILALTVLALAGGRAGSAAAATTGLVASYSFDEGSGTAVKDGSGNGNNGTVAGTAWTTGGRYGGALSFNGSSSSVTVPDAPSLDLTTGLTLEGWVKPAALGTAWRTVIFKEQDGAAGMDYSLYAGQDSGVPVAQVFQGSEWNAAGSAGLPLNAWSFVASTYDGTMLRLYVNGTEVSSTLVPGAAATSAGPLRIGGNSVWPEWFQGLIDNVRIYNRALSPSELATDMNTAVGAAPTPAPVPSPAPSGPVAAYSFDEGAGSTVGDASGGGNVGTVANTTWTTGKYGKALSFDGSSSWVTVPDSAALDPAGAVTLEAWVSPRSLASWSNLIAKERTGGFPYALDANAADTSSPNAHVLGSASLNVRGSSQLPLNSWTHLAETYDGSTLKLYVNGSLAASVAGTGAMPNSSGPLRIGGNSIHGDFFDGSIDDVRVYNRALSASEIQTDMKTPVGSAGSPAPPPPAADTQAPTAPGGLAASSKTASSVSVTWTSSSDNVGVAGYGLYSNGASVGSSATTSATFSGLACGTSYTLAVDAYDAAGNRSAKSSVSAATAACPTPGPSTGNANLWVDPSGGSCTRLASAGAYVNTQACGSLDAAYQAASPGDVVLIKGGSYGSQSIGDRSFAAGNPIVFHPAPGESVTINGDLRVDGHDITIDGGDVVNKDEVNRITVTGSFQAWMASGQSETRNVVFEDIHGASTFDTAHGLTLRYNEIGPNAECTSGAADLIDLWPNAGTPKNLYIIGNLVHDNNQNPCLGNGDHTDALQIYPGGGNPDNVVIRGNRFWWCGEQCVFLGDGDYTHTIVENNMIEETAACGNCGPAMEVNFYSANPTGDVFQYNTVDGFVSLPPNIPARGNVFLTAQNCSGASYSFNVFPASGGSTCGSNAKRCAPILANGSPYSGDNKADWHLSTTDTCARGAGDPSNYPATDLDGQTRPAGAAAPDAGADEVG